MADFARGMIEFGWGAIVASFFIFLASAALAMSLSWGDFSEDSQIGRAIINVVVYGPKVAVAVGALSLVSGFVLLIIMEVVS